MSAYCLLKIQREGESLTPYLTCTLNWPSPAQHSSGGWPPWGCSRSCQWQEGSWVNALNSFRYVWDLGRLGQRLLREEAHTAAFAHRLENQGLRLRRHIIARRPTSLIVMMILYRVCIAQRALVFVVAIRGANFIGENRNLSTAAIWVQWTTYNKWQLHQQKK